MDQRGLAADVVKFKKTFYHASYAEYDACLAGGLRLAPGSALDTYLRADFKKMRDAGMFYADPPSFDNILDRLRELQDQINGHADA